MNILAHSDGKSHKNPQCESGDSLIVNGHKEIRDNKVSCNLKFAEITLWITFNVYMHRFMDGCRG
jgi:hypothetical protein